MFDALSGPKGSLFDAKEIDYSTGTPPGWDATTKLPITKAADQYNLSTGGLSTGIGFGANSPVMSAGAGGPPLRLADGNFTDDYIPGMTKPDGVASTDARYVYIGGGKSAIQDGTGHGAGPTGNGYPAGWYHSEPVPYLTGYALGGMGGVGLDASPTTGSSRDAGAGPAYTSFPVKTVTGAALRGVAIEAGWINRSPLNLVAGQSAFGSGTTATVAPTMGDPEEDPELLFAANDDDGNEEEVEEEVDEPDDEGAFRRVVRRVTKKKAAKGK
jgi:hypothetical protein